MRLTPLLSVVVVATATVIVGLATADNALVVIGLLVSTFGAVVEHMRGETDLSLDRDGVKASGTLINPEDVEREALQLLLEAGITGKAAEATGERIRHRAQHLLPADDPVVVGASVDARHRVTRAMAADLLAGECAICGVSARDVQLEGAHITPLSAGGEAARDNPVALCPNCHWGFDSEQSSLPSSE